jgi:hypothetical protein
MTRTTTGLSFLCLLILLSVLIAPDVQGKAHGEEKDQATEDYNNLVHHKWWRKNVIEKDLAKMVDWLTKCRPDTFTIYQNGLMRNRADESEYRRKLRGQEEEFFKDQKTNIIELAYFRAKQKLEEIEEFGSSVTFTVQGRETRNEIVEKILNAIEETSNRGDWPPVVRPGRSRG